MKKFFVKLYVHLVYIIRALNRINEPKLGDQVSYRGEKWILIQGVNDPYWNLHRQQTRALSRTAEYIHRYSFILEPLHKRFIFSFNTTFRFFMMNWYQIDVDNIMAGKKGFMYTGQPKKEWLDKDREDIPKISKVEFQKNSMINLLVRTFPLCFIDIREYEALSRVEIYVKIRFWHNRKQIRIYLEKIVEEVCVPVGMHFCITYCGKKSRLRKYKFDLKENDH